MISDSALLVAAKLVVISWEIAVLLLCASVATHPFVHKIRRYRP